MATYQPLSNIEFCASFPQFVVWSCGPTDDVADLTITAINQTIPFLERLSLDLGARKLPCVSPKSFEIDAACIESSTRLKQFLDLHGSDKANHHNYHHVYGSILKNPESVTAVFEIGLGTNNTDVVSNMGAQGRPGSSLRAFRDYLPNAQIFGADVDRRILFEEDRIRTYFIDQTDLHTVDALSATLNLQFDLIIDDGLHSPNANIASIIFGLRHVKPGGFFVVEDIAPSHYPIWQVIAALLPSVYETTMVSANAGSMFVIKRKY